MQYSNIVHGKFIERPNRFIALAQVDGNIEKVHVKNTGRCRELLIPGTDIFLEKHNNPTRKTKYSLIAVKKGSRLINMDSQIPNGVVTEYLRAGGIFGQQAFMYLPLIVMCKRIVYLSVSRWKSGCQRHRLKQMFDNR